MDLILQKIALSLYTESNNMTTNTYVAIRTTVVGTATNEVTFASLPTNYTDLRIVVSGTAATSSYCTVRFNGDTGNNYSNTETVGDGSTATSYTNTGNPYGYSGSIYTTQTINTIEILNYRNSTTNKTYLHNTFNASAGIKMSAALWRNTAAITSITIGTGGAVNFNVGTSFTVYGIKSFASEETPKATGGYVYSDSSYWYHAFPFSSTFVPNQTLSCDVLAVAGGGGGFIGGGGAGGLLTFMAQSFNTTTHTITVGAGGRALINNNDAASKGGNTSVGALTAAVGGGSGLTNDNGGSTFGSGGSGGGGGGSSTITTTGGTGTVGQGNNGGTNGGFIGANFPSGGGGGAGGAGGNSLSLNIGGAGGIGATSALINAIGAATGYGQLSGGNYYFAGGGGGGGNGVSVFGLGGLGGGANGSNVPVANGTVSTGGGGGAYNGGVNGGGNGGSGIVVIRYAK